MLSVAEARARVLALVAPLGGEEIPLAEAGGRILLRDVVATRDQPPFAASAMDGYALRGAGAGPGAVLRMIGVSQAGARFKGRVGPGEAVRIFTGAPMPEGADAVLIQEDADRTGETIRVREGRDRGRNVRPAGADFVAGDRLRAPRRLRPAEIALIAAMNARTVTVTRRPVVAVIATGDELVSPGAAPGPDQVVSSNSYGLKAMLEAAGAEVRLLPIARDSAAHLNAAFDLAAGADLIVTLGGASVGDFDLVRPVAAARGMAGGFHKVAIRPGKPLMAGRMGSQALLGLPGNPVSALVCAQVFALPAVERMLGLPADEEPRLQARLVGALGPNGPRAQYLRAAVDWEGGWRCAPSARQDSALLSVLASANALLVRPPDDPALLEGDSVEFIWIK